jgi:hypothetical protein
VLGELASGDGTAMRAGALDAGMTMVVTFEQGGVARLPRVAMVPAWTIEVSGVVRDLAASAMGCSSRRRWR